MNSDETYMRRCFDLALNGVGAASPNPLVGCVIVHNGDIIGEGWCRKYGGPHAEVDAVSSVKDASLLANTTVYVNLEPCSHFGKTPPCADMLIERRVKKVVISNVDSNKLVSGKGIEKLRNAGIEVVTGMLEAEGRHFNRRFFTFMEKKRPYIILKWAQTSDGFISRNSHDASRISNSLSQQLVHRWRSEEDAFLVGTQTAATDNPKLNVRDWAGRDPLRVVIDRSLRLDPSLHLFDGQQPTVCYNSVKNEEKKNITFVKINDPDFTRGVVDDLYHRNVQSVVVEGGSTTIGFFIASGLWDEARVLRAPAVFGEGLKAPSLNGEPVSTTAVGGDTLTIYQNFSVTPAPLK